MEWIKFSEGEMPRVGVRVIIVTDTGSVVEAVRYHHDKFNRFGIECTAIFWMPLPQPPEER